MKSINYKCVKVFTNGVISFSYASLTNSTQIIFYEKDFRTLPFSKKSTKNQTLQSQSSTSYKSKYKL
jgi:hypothetical protein